MGMAVRRSTPRATVIIGFGSGFAAALVFLAVQQPAFSLSSLLWGCVAGLSQGLGWMAFARGLRDSSIGVAAPVAATVTAVTLYAVNAVQGKVVSGVSVVGILIALAALAFFRRSPNDETPGQQRSTSPAILFSVGAGLAFSVQALALVQAGTRSSALVLTGTGAGVLVLLGATTALRPIPQSAFKAARAAAVPAGLAIFAGDVSYLYALKNNVPVIASVIAQMHPLVTALLAFALLRERLKPAQSVALFCACAGVAIIAFG